MNTAAPVPCLVSPFDVLLYISPLALPAPLLRVSGYYYPRLYVFINKKIYIYIYIFCKERFFFLNLFSINIFVDF